jgi:hypothetical protein
MGRTAERLSGSYRGRRPPIEGDSCPWRAASCRRWGWARKPIEKAPAHCLGPRTAVLGGHGGRIRGVRIQIDGLAQPAFHRSSDGGPLPCKAEAPAEHTPVGQRRGRAIPESHPPASGRRASICRPRMATCAQLVHHKSVPSPPPRIPGQAICRCPAVSPVIGRTQSRVIAANPLRHHLWPPRAGNHPTAPARIIHSCLHNRSVRAFRAIPTTNVAPVKSASLR